MKKLFIMVGMLLLIPFAAYSFQAVSEDSMKDFTGQAGVDLTFEGATVVNVGITDLTWGDEDGYGATGTAGLLLLEGTIGADITLADATTLGIDIDGDEGIVITGLSTVSVDVTMPATLTLGLGPDLATAQGVANTLGSVGLASTTVSISMPGALHVMAH